MLDPRSRLSLDLSFFERAPRAVARGACSRHAGPPGPDTPTMHRLPGNVGVLDLPGMAQKREEIGIAVPKAFWSVLYETLSAQRGVYGHHQHRKRVLPEASTYKNNRYR